MEQMEGIENSPLEQVVCNELILESIFKNLKKADLEKVRLVSLLWYNTATKMIQKERKWKVKIKPRTTFKDLVATVASATFPGTVHEWNFEELLCADTFFGSDHFTASEEDIQILKYLGQRLGEFATGIMVRYGQREGFEHSIPRPAPSKLLSCVLRKATKLMELHLCLCSCPITEHEYRALEFDDLGIELPNLRHITFEYCKGRQNDFIETLLDAAPNLETIKTLNLGSLDAIIASNKVACVKELSFERNYLSTKWNQRLKKFATSNPVIKYVDFDIIDNSHEDMDLQKALEGVLVACQKTLKRMTLSGLDLSQYCDPVPVFDHLTHLEIKRNNFVLPVGASSSTCFPALHHVSFGLFRLGRNEWCRHFPEDDIEVGRIQSFPGVRTLHIKFCFYSSKGIEALAKKFPNLTDVQFTQEIQESQESEQTGIWNLPKSVENLTLHYLAVEYFCRMKGLDDVLIGAGESEIAELKKGRFDDEVVQRLVSQRGIGKLTGLKNFKIIFDVDEGALMFTKSWMNRVRSPKDSEIPFFMDEQLITSLATLYANDSSLPPTLVSFDKQVHCAKQIRGMLRPLEPFVKVDDSYESPSRHEDLGFFLSFVKSRPGRYSNIFSNFGGVFGLLSNAMQRDDSDSDEEEEEEEYYDSSESD